MTPVRLKPRAPRSRVKHSTTEPLRSLELVCKLINRTPGSRHLVSSIPGSALRTHVLKSNPVNFVSNDSHLVSSIYSILIMYWLICKGWSLARLPLLHSKHVNVTRNATITDQTFETKRKRHYNKDKLYK